MRVTSATIGLPVTDLDTSVAWYQRVLELGEPHQSPVEGVVEFDLGPVWLQLFGQEAPTDESRVAVRLGVEDVLAEHQRLQGLGIEVEDVVLVERTLEFFDLQDPDGHLLTIYTVRG